MSYRVRKSSIGGEQTSSHFDKLHDAIRYRAEMSRVDYGDWLIYHGNSGTQVHMSSLEDVQWVLAQMKTENRSHNV
jgi:hypothetical protein